MDDLKKMIRAVINGQSALKQELLKRIGIINKKVDNLDKKVDEVETRLTKRLDKLGGQLAFLEEDAPTREEHDQLDGRVKKLENRFVSV